METITYKRFMEILDYLNYTYRYDGLIIFKNNKYLIHFRKRIINFFFHLKKIKTIPFSIWASCEKNLIFTGKIFKNNQTYYLIIPNYIIKELNHKEGDIISLRLIKHIDNISDINFFENQEVFRFYNLYKDEIATYMTRKNIMNIIMSNKLSKRKIKLTQKIKDKEINFTGIIGGFNNKQILLNETKKGQIKIDIKNLYLIHCWGKIFEIKWPNFWVRKEIK